MSEVHVRMKGRTPVGNMQPQPYLLRRRIPDYAVEREQYKIIRRQDAKSAARVEHGEVVIGASRIEQDARDQKAGKHEEKIDPAPAKTERLVGQNVQPGCVGRNVGREVEKQHQ